MHFEVAGTAIRWCGVVVIVYVCQNDDLQNSPRSCFEKGKCGVRKTCTHTHTHVSMHTRVDFAKRGSYGSSWQSVQIRTANTKHTVTVETHRNSRQTAVFLLLLSVMLRILRILFCMLLLSRWRCFIFVNVYCQCSVFCFVGGNLCTVTTTSTSSHTN